MSDKKVAGFYNNNDHPDTTVQLRNMMQQQTNPTPGESQAAQEVANMIRGIELNDAERQARDEAALKAA